MKKSLILFGVLISGLWGLPSPSRGEENKEAQESYISSAESSLDSAVDENPVVVKLRIEDALGEYRKAKSAGATYLEGRIQALEKCKDQDKPPYARLIVLGGFMEQAEAESRSADKCCPYYDFKEALKAYGIAQTLGAPGMDEKLKEMGTVEDKYPKELMEEYNQQLKKDLEIKHSNVNLPELDGSIKSLEAKMKRLAKKMPRGTAVEMVQERKAKTMEGMTIKQAGLYFPFTPNFPKGKPQRVTKESQYLLDFDAAYYAMQGKKYDEALTDFGNARRDLSDTWDRIEKNREEEVQKQREKDTYDSVVSQAIKDGSAHKDYDENGKPVYIFKGDYWLKEAEHTVSQSHDFKAFDGEKDPVMQQLGQLYASQGPKISLGIAVCDYMLGCFGSSADEMVSMDMKNPGIAKNYEKARAMFDEFGESGLHSAGEEEAPLPSQGPAKESREAKLKRWKADARKQEDYWSTKGPQEALFFAYERTMDLDLALADKHAADGDLKGALAYCADGLEAKSRLTASFEDKRGTIYNSLLTAKITELRKKAGLPELGKGEEANVGRSADSKDLLAKGIAFFRAKQYPEAATEFQQLLKNNPDDVQGVNYLAWTYYHLKNDQLVFTMKKMSKDDELYLSGVRYFSDTSTKKDQLGYTSKDLGISDIQQLVQDNPHFIPDPDMADGQLIVADIQYASQLYEDAAKNYKAWLASHPDDATALGMLGGCEVEGHDDASARIHLQAALAKEPDQANAWLFLGTIAYDDDKNYREAADDLEKAFKSMEKQNLPNRDGVKKMLEEARKKAGT